VAKGIIWRGTEPITKFGPRIYAPMYFTKDGTEEFNKRLIEYVLECEKICVTEELVSDLPKNTSDPYKYTQQWKQHNLLDDSGSRKDGDHLKKFKSNPIQKELFDKIRTNYLLMLEEFKFPRIKCWIHTWGNVLRPGEFISKHSHIPGNQAYLASVYYPHAAPTKLALLHPISNDEDDLVVIPTVESSLVFFPSWITHVGTKVEYEGLRISVASDIVTERTMQHNPWRPHLLFDDPETMPGL
jgi:hypothetical protein